MEIFIAKAIRQIGDAMWRRKVPLTGQSHAWLIAIDEFDSSELQGSPNGGQVVDRGDSATFFKVANGALAQVGPSSQFSLRPVEQSGGCPRLIGGHSTAISWESRFPSISHEKR